MNQLEYERNEFYDLADVDNINAISDDPFCKYYGLRHTTEERSVNIKHCLAMD